MGHHQHHTNIYALQNNPSIGWVHPKSTHGHPLAWGNNNITKPSTHTYTNRANMRQTLLLHIDRVTTPSTHTNWAMSLVPMNPTLAIANPFIQLALFDQHFHPSNTL